MKMTRFIALLLLPIGAVSVSAQQLMLDHDGVKVYSTDVSGKNPGKTSDEFYDIREDGATALMVQTGEIPTVGFWDYDKNLKLKGSVIGNKEIGELTKPLKGENPVGFISFGGQFYFLRGHTDYDRKENRVVLYRLSNDPEKQPEPIELTSLSGSGFYNNMNYSGLTMKKSDDGSKLMVAFKLGHDKSSSGKVTYRFKVIVLDSDIQKLWESDVTVSDKAGTVEVGNRSSLYGESVRTFKIGDNGSVFFWGLIDRGSDKSAGDRYRLKVYRVDEQGTVGAIMNKPPSVSNYVVSITDNRMVMASPYVKRGAESYNSMEGGVGQIKTEGFEFLYWEGVDGADVQRVKMPLSVEHLSKNSRTKQVEKLKKIVAGGKKPLSLMYLSCTDLFALEDGSVVLVASQFLGSNIHDIHVFRLDEKKELAYSDLIPLYHLGSANGSGFESVLVDNRLFLVFNDIPLNVDRDWSTLGPEKYVGSDGQLSVVRLDIFESDRPHVRKAVWKEREMGGRFEPFRTEWKAKSTDVGYFYFQGSRNRQRIVQFNLN